MVDIKAFVRAAGFDRSYKRNLARSMDFCLLVLNSIISDIFRHVYKMENKS